MSKKLIALSLAICMLFCLSACGTTETSSNQINTPPESQRDGESLPDVDGNPYTKHETIDGETYISYDYSTVYDTLDLSQYASWGTFGADGLMWVEKSDYTGKQFGYIDYKGNLVIPFSSEIVTPGDFAAGYAIVCYEYDGFGMGNGIRGVMNTNGEIKLKFNNHAISKCYRSDNGNIVFVGINLMDDLYSSETKNYIFCGKTGKTIEISGGPVASDGMYYSNGLLRTYRTEWYTDENNYNAYKDVVTFYDENGVEALTIDTNSSEYYKSLLYVEDFVDEKSVVYFWGLDRNYYKVEIDKTGKWITEPVKIDEEKVQRF